MRGHVRVEQATAFPERFAAGSLLYVRGAPLRVEASRKHGRVWLVKLQGVDSAEAAAALAGESLTVPEADLRPLPSGTFYHYHLLGMRVVSTQGEALGRVTEILETPANDVYVVSGPRGEVLLPAIADVVKEVDVKRGVMSVEPLPGML